MVRACLLGVQQITLEASGRGSAWLERLVRDQEVGGSNPLAPTNSFNSLEAVDGQTAHPTAHPVPKLLREVRAPYTAAMAKNAASHLPAALPSGEQPASSGRTLAPVIDINIRHLGRKPQPQTLNTERESEACIAPSTAKAACTTQPQQNGPPSMRVAVCEIWALIFAPCQRGNTARGASSVWDASMRSRKRVLSPRFAECWPAMNANSMQPGAAENRRARLRRGNSRLAASDLRCGGPRSRARRSSRDRERGRLIDSRRRAKAAN